MGGRVVTRYGDFLADAGFDEVYIRQVGGEHDGFFEFYAEQELPHLWEG
jgi:hypothetical protein